MIACIKRKSRFLACVFCFMAVLSPYVSAAAYDADYLDFDKWMYSDNVSMSSVSSDSVDGSVQGVVRYYVDSADRCLYLFLDLYDTAGIDPSGVRIGFDITDSKENYRFSINRDGMCDCNSGMERVFTVYQHFEVENSCLRGRYACAVQFGNTGGSNTVNVTYWNRGTACNILSRLNVVMAVSTTGRTTTVRTTKPSASTTRTTSATVGKTTKTTAPATTAAVSSTKFYATTTALHSVSTTAFHSSGSSTASSGQVVITTTGASASAPQQSAQAADTALYSPPSADSHMTDQAKGVMAAAIVIIAFAAALITIGIAKKVRAADDEKPAPPADDNDDGFDF